MENNFVIDNCVVSKLIDNSIQICSIRYFNKNNNIDANSFQKFSTGNKVDDNLIISKLTSGNLSYENVWNQFH